MTDGSTYASPTDRAYWGAFERQLATKPCLVDRPDLVRELTCAAHLNSTRRASSHLGPEEYAELAYRIRFGLGPMVSASTLDDVRKAHEQEALSLIAEGVSPRLLGLAG